MMRRDQAEKQLEQLTIKDWDKKRAAEMADLPEKSREIGRGVLGYDKGGKAIKDWSKRYQTQHKCRQQLATLSARDRRRIFDVLFPKVSAYLEAGWQLCARLPYEMDGDRKGFRAPGDDKAANEMRITWFDNLVDELSGFDGDIEWCAAWACHLGGGYGADSLGILLAAAIDSGGEIGERVFEILKQSTTNEHPIGGMGRHVTRALLVASRTDGWEYVEKLLLAAQRQEGLRQVILESIDEAHPEAFRRMLRLILEHNLIRFSSTVRAVDCWFGLQWDSATPGVIKKSLETVQHFLENPHARSEAINRETGETLYFALWVAGFEDAHQAIPLCVSLLKDESVERRFVGVTMLNHLELPAARQHLLPALNDEDLRVALAALEACREVENLDLFDPILKLLERLPTKKQELPALVWPWATTTVDRKEVCGYLVNHLGKRSPTVLMPFLNDLPGYARGQLVHHLGKMKNWTPAIRDTLVALVGDRDSWVRQQALNALKKATITEEDAHVLEGHLGKKASDLRQAALSLLKKQKAPAVLASADRLLASKKSEHRLGGLELLRIQVEAKKSVAECRARAETFRAERKELDEEELLQVEAILDLQSSRPTLDNALGLMDPAQRSKAPAPKARKVTLLTAATVACLQSLDELIHKHAETPIKIRDDDTEEEKLLGDLYSWEFPSVHVYVPVEEDVKRLPLRELWEGWYKDRPKKLIDRDGLELVRALVWCGVAQSQVNAEKKQFKGWKEYFALLGDFPLPKLKHSDLVDEILTWLLRLHPAAGAMDFALDAVETGFALVPPEALKVVVKSDDWRQRDKDWRNNSPVDRWINLQNRLDNLIPGGKSGAQRVRLWHLMHWHDEPHPGVARFRPDLDELVAAAKAGLTTEADLFDHLIGPGQDDFGDLSTLTTAGNKDLAECPALQAVVGRIRERILEIETKRGELPTAASEPAQALRSLFGLETLQRLWQALGKKPFARQTYGQGRAIVLTNLIQATHPATEDTLESSAAVFKAMKLSKERLLELAFLAPQWLDHIEHTLGWQGLREGVWWYLAHMPGGHSGLVGTDEADHDDDEPGQQTDPWSKVIAERTSLTPEERDDGAVDTAWFHRVFPVLGRKRWDALGEAAKYGCTDSSFKKATQLSEVLQGRAKRATLVADIRDRKLKGSVRLLGLLPLPESDKREAELAARYKVLQEYRRYAKSLSPLSREDSVRTAEIGLNNLARTAGYSDPIRMEWAMEAREIADLAEGPQSATFQGVTVTLAIDDQAQPILTVKRGDRELKSLPSNIRKNPKIGAIADRRMELKRSASRVKQSLEGAMIRGDAFSGAELKQLFAHPLLRPLLERLVLVGEGIAGFPTHQGQALTSHDGKVEPVKPAETLRIAHGHDLYKAGDWDKWQAHLFQREIVQPFKQVFRELYVLTAQEKSDGNVSHRYTGQQINPMQAQALWGSRLWSTREEISKTFHALGLVAEVTFQHHGWTAAQVEGWTVDAVQFRKRGEYSLLPLSEIPPRIFSEVMRDCDLVVSVAHRGGVDPEASASTVEMRTSLVRETCSLLGLKNVRFQSQHVLIDGQLSKYSIHLGSGVVHRQPGGHLCIVPVHAQHRGRLFLPFADDDPRTAEVVSKVLLLARDNEIQDPLILEQLR